MCVLSCFSHVWLCDPMDCSLSGSSIHGILQARVLEWVATASSRGSSWPRDRTPTSYISYIGWFFTTSTTWRWHPTPVLLPGKIQWTEEPGRLQSLGSLRVRTERLHLHFSPSRIGEENGNPLQYSCLENSRDRGGWWAAIYGVAQSRTRLKRLSSSSSTTWEAQFHYIYCPSANWVVYLFKVELWEVLKCVCVCVSCVDDFPGGSDGKESACNAGAVSSVLGSRRFPWRRKWQPTPWLSN